MEAFILVQWVSMPSSRASFLLNLPLVSIINVLRRSSMEASPPPVVENSMVVARHSSYWHKRNFHGFLGSDGSEWAHC